MTGPSTCHPADDSHPWGVLWTKNGAALLGQRLTPKKYASFELNSGQTSDASPSTPIALSVIGRYNF